MSIHGILEEQMRLRQDILSRRADNSRLAMISYIRIQAHQVDTTARGATTKREKGGTVDLSEERPDMLPL
jgi:hypothetical protein